MDRAKQVIVMRKDLNMRKGKMIAQGAHASMKVLLDAGRPLDNATFQIKWRARMRRLSLPNVTSMLAGAGLEILFNLQKYDQFKKLHKVGANRSR